MRTLSSIRVERLDEAGVGDGRADPLLGQIVGGVERDLGAEAVAEERHPLAGSQGLPRPDRDRLGGLG
jgi:hypothetical protein